MSDKQEWTDFRAVFDQILSKLSPVENSQEFIQTFEWLQRMLRYNIPHGKCNRGMAVIETYRLLAEQQNKVSTEEELELARVLGWTVEFLQAYFLIVDDLMDSSITRRGQPCWYRQEDVGLIACNDAIMLDQENYHILKMYLSKHPQYLNIFELIHEVFTLILSTFNSYFNC